MSYFCPSYCSHGGRCVLRPGHDGDHDSQYCTWTDGQALTREQADTVLAQGSEEGAFYVKYQAPLADLLEALAPEDP